MTARLDDLIEREKPVKEPNYEKIEAILTQDWKEAYQQLDRPSKRDFWRILIKEIRIFPDRSIDYDFAQ